MQVTSKTLTPAANDTPRPSNPSTPQPSTTVETLPDLAPLTKMIASGLNNIEECLLLTLHTAQEKHVNTAENPVTQKTMQPTQGGYPRYNRPEKGAQKAQRRSRRANFELNTFKGMYPQTFEKSSWD